MKIKQTKLKLIKYLTISILIFLNLSITKAISIESKIILKINNSIITNTDIKNEANYLKALNPNLINLDDNKIKQIAKNSLVKEKIKEFEISKLDNQTISADY